MFLFPTRRREPDLLAAGLRDETPALTGLVTELAGAGDGPLLVCSPAGASSSAYLAGALAAAARDGGHPSPTIIDLRHPDRTDAAAGAAGVVTAAGGVQVMRPDPSCRRSAADTHAAVDQALERAAEPGVLRIMICGPVDGPRDAVEDPVAWAHLQPRVLVACRRGGPTVDQIQEAAARLARARLNVVGGVLCHVGRRRRKAPADLVWCNLGEAPKLAMEAGA
jgi:hypothetical protein